MMMSNQQPRLGLVNQPPTGPRFFHMPRFQGPPQLQSKPFINFRQAAPVMNPAGSMGMAFDGKRMRRAVYRKTVDYNCSVINYLEVIYINALRTFLLLTNHLNFNYDKCLVDK